MLCFLSPGMSKRPSDGMTCVKVQAHGGDSSLEEDPALFFLPHRPLGQDGKPGTPLFPPLFLLMKGSDWRGAGADHYEPLLTQKRMDEGCCEPYITLDDV